MSGFICAISKKGESPEFTAPLAYGNDDMPAPEMLLRDRGATIFESREAARQALEVTLISADSQGHEWPSLFNFHFIEVKDPFGN
ncbi:MAG: hypothetical protein JMN25_14640 [gamma proteobacterium endosymbiont of Lamellibrachia anaximandri]|nr:hypothetical protein [gamma proteobacterium endosymbiont of Lamellibrachia anaximandri]